MILNRPILFSCSRQDYQCSSNKLQVKWLSKASGAEHHRMHLLHSNCHRWCKGNGLANRPVMLLQRRLLQLQLHLPLQALRPLQLLLQLISNHQLPLPDHHRWARAMPLDLVSIKSMSRCRPLMRLRSNSLLYGKTFQQDLFCTFSTILNNNIKQ